MDYVEQDVHLSTDPDKYSVLDTTVNRFLISLCLVLNLKCFSYTFPALTTQGHRVVQPQGVPTTGWHMGQTEEPHLIFYQKFLDCPFTVPKKFFIISRKYIMCHNHVQPGENNPEVIT